MLTSDNVADHYDVTGVPGDQHSRGTIVFLGGLGAPRATAELQAPPPPERVFFSNIGMITWSQISRGGSSNHWFGFNSS